MAHMKKRTFDILEYGEGRSKTLLGDSFHVDDLLAPTIQILNRKYYLTEACCAGEHKLRIDGIKQDLNGFGVCWILFKDGVFLPSLPSGFNKSSHPSFPKDSWYISRTCDAHHNETLNQLYKWAMDLPIFLSIMCQ